MPSLEGRSVVVTGAGSGIGRAIALEASAQRARVLLVGRREEALVDAARSCEQVGGQVRVLVRDVADNEAPAEIVSAALEAWGRLDAVVNNAGLARFGAIDTFPDEWLDEMYRINLRAPLRLIRASLGALRASKGVVVNISSIGGVVGTPGRVAYGALKAALNHATRSLARELAPDVRVNAVLPGPIFSPMWENLGLDAARVESLLDEMLRTTPTGRLGAPEDVAPWVCDLLSERGRWITGSMLTIDGGRSA